MTLTDAMTALEELVEEAVDELEREDLLIFIGYLHGTASRLVGQHT